MRGLWGNKVHLGPVHQVHQRARAAFQRLDRMQHSAKRLAQRASKLRPPGRATVRGAGARPACKASRRGMGGGGVLIRDTVCPISTG